MPPISRSKITNLISTTLNKVENFEKKYQQTKEIDETSELSHIYNTFLKELNDSKKELSVLNAHEVFLTSREKNLIESILASIFKLENPLYKDKQQKAVDFNNSLFWDTLIQIKDQLINFEKNSGKDKKITKVEKDQLKEKNK